MKYAVIASGGKQYKVSEGAVVELEKLKAEDGSEINFESVLFFAEDGSIKIGQPNLTNVSVTAKVLGQIKAPKIRVAKFKAKARYRKVYGHRQHLTKVQIEKISVGTSKKAEPAEKTKEKADTKKSKV